jgi:hypothetical protein
LAERTFVETLRTSLRGKLHAMTAEAQGPALAAFIEEVVIRARRLGSDW